AQHGAAGAQRISRYPVDKVAQFRLERRDVELALDVPHAVVEPGIGVRIIDPGHPRRHARTQRNGHQVPGRERKPFRHPVGEGLVEGDGNEDIDDAFGHGGVGRLGALNQRGRKGRYMSPMSSERPAPDVAFAANEVTREFAGWLGHLAPERRLSPKTVEAYERDVRQFLIFLSGHLGKRVTLPALSRLKPLDVRAFIAGRRNDGVSSRSLMRMLAGARSFARFLERNGKGKIGALSAVRSPKLTRTLPTPLAIAAAKRITDTGLRAGEEREPWIL